MVWGEEGRICYSAYDYGKEGLIIVATLGKACCHFGYSLDSFLLWECLLIEVHIRFPLTCDIAYPIRCSSFSIIPFYHFYLAKTHDIDVSSFHKDELWVGVFDCNEWLSFSKLRANQYYLLFTHSIEDTKILKKLSGSWF